MSSIYGYSLNRHDAVLNVQLVAELVTRCQKTLFESKTPINVSASITREDATWKPNSFEGFLDGLTADMETWTYSAYWSAYGTDEEEKILESDESPYLNLSLSGEKWGSVSLEMDDVTKAQVYAVQEVFEDVLKRAEKPVYDGIDIQQPVKVFIGHGRSEQWRKLKDHLKDQHNVDVVAYEVGARAGHTIRDILQEMMYESTMAFLVLTAEDEQEDGSTRARQNVVHETGLFQGRLGFSKAIVLKEEGTELFTNLDGIQYISFARGNIIETFGPVLATIRREFGGW